MGWGWVAWLASQLDLILPPEDRVHRNDANCSKSNSVRSSPYSYSVTEYPYHVITSRVESSVVGGSSEKPWPLPRSGTRQII